MTRLQTPPGMRTVSVGAIGRLELAETSQLLAGEESGLVVANDVEGGFYRVALDFERVGEQGSWAPIRRIGRDGFATRASGTATSASFAFEALELVELPAAVALRSSAS